MDIFNTQFGEKLREKNVPENIEFDFDAAKEYRFVTKSLYSVLARIIADEDASENISHLAYSGGKISGNDGAIKLGITDLGTVPEKVPAQVGHRQLMDIRAEE